MSAGLEAQAHAHILLQYESLHRNAHGAFKGRIPAGLRAQAFCVRGYE